jgi:hypothetical protein
MVLTRFAALILLMLSACAPAADVTLTPLPSQTPTLIASSTPASADDPYVNLPQVATALGFPQIGFANAPVSVVAYYNFDCAGCGSFQTDLLPRLLQRVRASEVLLTLVPLYTANAASNGETAARAALCAAEQGAFWRYYDALAAGSGAYTSERLIAAVEAVNLDRAAWDSCMLSARLNGTLASAQSAASNQFEGQAVELAVIVNNEPVAPDRTSVDNAISVAAARVSALIEAAISATDTPIANATPDELATAPVAVTLPPLQNQPIPPPITISLPAGWRSANDTLVLNDVDGVRSVPFSIYTGSVTGGVGTIVLLWGFPNLVAGNPFDAASAQPDLFADGLRLLRLAIVEQGCNVGTDLQRGYSIGGLSATGTQFSAVTCPGLPDTRGWFAGLQFNGINYVFYVYSDPIESIDGARAELQAILETVRFVTPTPAP